MPADGSHQSFLPVAKAIVERPYTGGVRWSGMSDDRRWKASPEAQAVAYAAYVKARDRQEAELAAMIAARKAGAA